jgi:predicted permease
VALPSLFAALRLRLRSLCQRSRVERELDEEITFHLEMETQELMTRRGLSRAEAQREARRRFGGVERNKEGCRDARGWVGLETTLRDLRQAARRLAASPGFTGVAVVSLALGIGATSALFSVVDAVLLKPLPYPQADRLVSLQELRPTGTSNGNPRRLLDWQGAQAFAGVAGFYTERQLLRTKGELRPLVTLRSAGPLGATLGVQPALGRLPTADEERGAGNVALVAHELWVGAFGRDLALLGSTLDLSGQPVTVLGILPPRTAGEEIDLWIPLSADMLESSRAAGFLTQVARLRPGVSREAAEAELATLAEGLARQHPETDAGLRAQLVPLQAAQTRAARAPLLLVFVAMAALLAIACLNLAGLQVARGLARQREVAIRLALGAARGRLLRQLLAESLLLALVGGLLGWLGAHLGLEALKSWLPADVPNLAAVSLDGRAALFALATTLLSVLVFGWVPAHQAARHTVATTLKEGGPGSGGARRQRLRSGLVVAQVALSTALLIGAGLLARSFVQLRQQPLGFEPSAAMSFRVAFGWDTPRERVERFRAAVLERLAALPGVREVGVVDRLPFAGGTQTAPAAVRGRELDAALAETEVSWRLASPGYFAAAGIPLRAGERYPEPPPPGEPVPVLVNERFARLFFADEPLLGRDILKRFDQTPVTESSPWLRIVGVLPDVRQSVAETPPEVYLPWGTSYWPLLSFVVRTDGEPGAMAGALRSAVQAVDAEVLVEDLGPFRQQVDAVERSPRERAILLGALALAALALALIGLYGVLSTEMLRRSRELALRLVLGAEPVQLVGNAVARGLALAGTGLALGLAAALGLARYLESLLYGIRAWDPSTFALAALLMLAVCGLAAYLPASQVTRIQSAEALRHE